MELVKKILFIIFLVILFSVGIYFFFFIFIFLLIAYICYKIYIKIKYKKPENMGNIKINNVIIDAEYKEKE